MNIKEFFGFTKSKLIVFIILAILTNIFPSIMGVAGVCVDGINFGYCINYHGFPFHSFIITGEIGEIPSTHLVRIITNGIMGFLGNLLIVYLILSLIFFIYYKFKKK